LAVTQSPAGAACPAGPFPDALPPVNAVNRSGATIFTNSSAAGSFFSYGTWAVTAP
jgi:hypothetical protein